ncbi:MAG: zinc dependent phospholipase C family protein [Clostridia bacterium]|nr:zinc dependent phospholipase C family protein [Clostridia bacterium]
MASWMVHLRIAEKLSLMINDISEREFVIGNIAPDSGVPNEDWSKFDPPYEVSHYIVTDGNGERRRDVAAFVSEYLSDEIIDGYTPDRFSFYLGYLAHLITDDLWIERVIKYCAEKFPDDYAADKKAAIWRWKKDFYDLDAKYLRDNPEFHAFNLYASSVGVENKYLEFFSRDAFDNRREYITRFYLEERDDLDREYAFFTEEEMNSFVENAPDEILKRLNSFVKKL